MQRPAQFIGAISAPALSRWERASDNDDNDELERIARDADGLDRVAFVSVERYSAAEPNNNNTNSTNNSDTAYHHRLVEHPVSPAVIRSCLIGTAAADPERAELQRLDIAPGLVRFNCGALEGRIRYRVKTWHAKMLNFHIRRRLHARGRPDKATWCTWSLPSQPQQSSSDTNNSSTLDIADQSSLQFWSSRPALSLSRFIAAYLAQVGLLRADNGRTAAHYTAEVTEGLGAWTWGTIEFGAHSAGFYRLAAAPAAAADAA